MRRSELLPITRWISASEPFGRTNLEDRPNHLAEPLREHLPGEGDRFSTFAVRQPIRLVQHKDQLMYVLGGLLDQCNLVAGDRRVRTDDYERRIDVRNERSGGFGVGSDDGADTGRVDETHPRGEQCVGNKHFDDAHPFFVGGVLLLGHVGRDFARGDGVPLGAQAHACSHSFAVAQHSDGCRDRHHTRRQQGLSNQRVQQRRLAAFELSNAGNVEPPFLQPLHERNGIGRNLGRASLFGQPCEVCNTICYDVAWVALRSRPLFESEHCSPTLWLGRSHQPSGRLCGGPHRRQNGYSGNVCSRVCTARQFLVPNRHAGSGGREGGLIISCLPGATADGEQHRLPYQSVHGGAAHLRRRAVRATMTEAASAEVSFRDSLHYLVSNRLPSVVVIRRSASSSLATTSLGSGA